MWLHFLEPLPAEAARLFVCQLTYPHKVTSGPIDAESAENYDILVAGVPQREDIKASTNLRALIIPWAGLPVKTRELMLDFPAIEVYNIHHNAIPTAESAITLMLSVARDTLEIDHRFRDNDWRPRYDSDRPLLIQGKSALVVGYGAIGKHIAKVCRALGMSVTAIRNSSPTQPDSDIKTCQPAELRLLLPQTNVLFLSLPLTPETTGMIGKQELAALPDDAIIVNISRGRVIDEEALYRELESGRLRAGLDVWYMYPRDEKGRVGQPPSVFPFAELPNVVMSPHMAGHCSEIESLRARALAELLNALARRDADHLRVDVQRGY